MKKNIMPANECLGRKYTFVSGEAYDSFKLKNTDKPLFTVSGSIEDANGKMQRVCVLSSSENADSVQVTVIAVLKDKNGNSLWICTEEEFLGTDICFECNLEFLYGDKYELTEVLYEKTCGAVMFTERNNERLYLLIKNDSGHIGFPKGHVEYGENEFQTAVREVKEETALTAEPIGGFRMAYSYVNAAGHSKTAVYFLSHYDYTAAEIQKEEIDDSWLLPYDEAVKMLNYPQDIPILEAAEKILNADRG